MNPTSTLNPAAERVHETEHTVTVEAPADVVYGIVADVGRWPVIFPPTVHVEQLERTHDTERIRIWATANDTVKTWTSRRELDPEARRVRFRQEVSAPPVAAMGGEWIVEPDGPGRCVVRLLHDYRAVDDDPEAVEWIARAVDRNSTAELASLAAAAERTADAARLTFTFDDSVAIDGDAADAYAFIDDAGRWADRLPHVARVRLTEDTPGIQVLEMDTLTADGATHTTSSVRVCIAGERIVYKQSRTPALMAAHTGEWRFEPDGDDITVVTSRHTVELVPAAVEKVLGAGATIEDARAFVRAALGRNSGTTLLAAKSHAEQIRRERPACP